MAVLAFKVKDYLRDKYRKKAVKNLSDFREKHKLRDSNEPSKAEYIEVKSSIAPTLNTFHVKFSNLGLVLANGTRVDKIRLFQ